MALQDFVPYTGAPTSNPYDPGDPRYVQYQMSYLLPQLYNSGAKNANARGDFYSGATLADQQQAAASLAANLTQSQSSQALQEQELQQQEAFQAQQQAQQNQSNAQIAAQQSKAQMASGALQGGLGAVGTLGGLYMMRPGGLFNPTPKVTTLGGSALSNGTDLAGMQSGSVTPGIGLSPLDLQNSFGGSALSGGTDLASMQELAQPTVDIAPSGLAALSSGAQLGTMGAGLLGTLGADKLIPGNSMGGEIGGAVGGLGGGIGGAMIGDALLGSTLGPFGAIAGAGLGSLGFGSLGKWLGGLF